MTYLYLILAAIPAGFALRIGLDLARIAEVKLRLWKVKRDEKIVRTYLDRLDAWAQEQMEK